jgi:inner membrane protein
MSLSDRIRNSVFIKMVFIGIIIVILLVPLLLIRGVISERQLRRDQAVYDVGEKWGGSQQIAGPIITVPYLVHYRDEKNILRSRKAYTQFLPEELNVRATLDTQIRSRGIFDVVVYTTHLDCAGSFGPLPLAEMNVALEDFLWDEAYIIIAVSDMRGITRAAEMEWNGEGHAFEPGVLNTELFPGWQGGRDRTAHSHSRWT